jgi:hypothetical protein
MAADVHSTDGYFAVIPEAILDADVSAQAVRLYAVLRRYADQRTGHAHPSRKTLAARMRVKDVKTVDRALDELQGIGAVLVFARYVGEDGSVSRVRDAAHPEQTSNGYTVRARINGQGGPTGATTPPPTGGERVAPQKGDEPEPLEPEPLEPEKTTARERAQGSRVPDPFPLTDDLRAWALENAPTVGLKDHEAFMDYWRGVPGAKGRKLDWPATWRNWMRRRHDDGGGRVRTTSPTGPRPGPDQRAADVAELARRLQQQHDAQTQIGA